MLPFDPKKRNRPEAGIQMAVEKMLRQRGWYVKRTHGSAIASGWPDDFATHKFFGQRWVEIKLPDMKGSRFTKAQLAVFPQFIANGSGVWILTASTTTEYEKLFKPCNFEYYLQLERSRCR